jgi:hypothetical protein
LFIVGLPAENFRLIVLVQCYGLLDL